MKFTEGLLLLFIALKLTHVVAWSWWVVLCPVWIPFALVSILVAISMVFGPINE